MDYAIAAGDERVVGLSVLVPFGMGAYKMTTGSLIADHYAGQSPWYIDGAYQGTTPTGRYSSRSWSGGDGLPVRLPPGPWRTYTIIDARGKVVKKKFRDRTRRVSKFKEPHAYSAQIRQFEASGNWLIREGITGYWERLRSGALYVGTTEWPPPGIGRPTIPSFDANDQLKLIGKLKEKIRGSDFNMAVTLGEGREVLSMIGNSAIRIAQALRLARKGNFIGSLQYLSKSASDHQRDLKRLPSRLKLPIDRKQSVSQLSSNWLELQYGWLPLLGDIQSGAELLANRLNVPARKRYSASIIKRNLDPYASRPLVGAADYAFSSRRIIAYISEQQESLPQLLGLMDPELVAWELTPFSFVADWIIPFGDWLEARAYASRLAGTFVTTDFTVSNVSGALRGNSYEFSPGHDYYAEVIEGGHYVDRYVSLTRSVSTSLAVPFPVVKPLKDVLSWKHCANAVALLVGVTKSIFR